VRNYKKKNRSDPIIEAANRAETPKEQALRGILMGILVIKDNPDLHPIYTGNENVDTILAHREWAIQRIMHNTIRELQENYEPPELIWDYSTHKDSPRLKFILDTQKRMFFKLVQNLQDPEWVSALCQCPECRKFLWSNTKWAKKGRKFCNRQCRTKYYGRKNKKGKGERKKTNDTILFKCPGNFEEVTITPTNCNNANEKNIRGKFHDCPTCDCRKYLEAKISTNIEFHSQILGQTVNLTPQEEKSSKDKGE
jgi:hypothetical protein